MRLPVILLTFALFGCIPQKAGPTGTEVLLGPTLSGWTFVDRIPSSDGTTARYLRYGETTERWTQMVTATTSPLSSNSSLKEFSVRVARGDEAACAVPARYNQPVALDRSYPTIVVSVTCGRNRADGQGRISMMILIEGSDAFYQVRHIWRVPAADDSNALTLTKDMTNDGLLTIGSTRVCDNGRPSRKC
jgi:hypothetical protein